MNILVVGNGGREHALCWKIAKSPLVKRIWVAEGNAGTAHEAKTQNIAIESTDIDALIKFAKQNQIDLTLVGPEAPLALGITDKFNQAGLKCFGPTQAAAQLESSKSFCKEFLKQYHIPTANFATFDHVEAALSHLEHQQFPLVIKADGLAAGKGVVIAQNRAEAKEAITSMLQDNKFGSAGKRIIIEDFLQGEELSFIALVDGENILPLASAQDHKRRDDGDQGPNTGGMGAYSPAPLLTPNLTDKIMRQIMHPTVQAMKSKNIPYVGFLYAGLMIANGEPKVLEFNCRLGDPETQPILFRLESDLVQLCLNALAGKLDQTQIKWDPRPAISVVLAAGGYPDIYRKGDVIRGLETTTTHDYKIFHASTIENNQKIYTNGGRVLSVTAIGKTLRDARQTAYQAAEKITWPDRFYRSDIGHRALDIS